MREAPAHTIYTLLAGAQPAETARSGKEAQSGARGVRMDLVAHRDGSGSLARERPQPVLWYNVNR